MSQPEEAKELVAVEPNFLMVFVDPEGRQWHAAGWMSHLTRYDADGNEVERVAPENSREKQFAVRHLNVIERS